MRGLPRFPVTMVGSWPRSRELLRAQRQKRAGTLDPDAFERIADDAVRHVIETQEQLGVDLVTDGEQRRDSFFSFVAEKLAGVRMMTLAEMLEIIEDKDSFERILQTLDVPAYAISNATCVGKIARERPLAVDELRFVKQHSDRPVKVPLPGPYLMTRAMWVKEACRQVYPTKESLGDDVVEVLRAELRELIAEGVAFVQFDEPVLTELVFTQGQARTFMCAALAASADPRDELEWAVSLHQRVLAGFEGETRFGVHVCRGNWSSDESTLLRGSYHPLRATLERLPVDQLVLEYATERAGDLLAFGAKELGLGLVNPRTERVESVDEIVRTVRRALELYPADRLFLNPDCGFATFSNRPVNHDAVARAKMRALVEASQQLRGV
ncbi:MAG: cobalamin-independent methionine synthase II family protein [Myxococcales bacterium]|nr:cobalamin-independent methionine synthase II family protein [Myxococcales bacterium]